MNKKSRICVHCKNEYVGFGEMFCSRSCRAKETGVGHGIKTGSFVNCLTCKKEIWRKGYLLNKFTVFFCSRKCNFEYKKTLDYIMTTGENNYNWKGDEVGYSVLHKWVRKNKGKAILCVTCQSDYSVEWANKSHEYKRDLDDWISLCKKCHYKYDSGEHWGKATKKYGLQISKAKHLYSDIKG